VTSDSSVRLAEVIATLSLATDLGMGQPPQYALRSCLLAIRLGDALGLDEDDLNDVYYLALLRFAGCTADAPLAAAAFGGDAFDTALRAMADFTDLKTPYTGNHSSGVATPAAAAAAWASFRRAM
jgi:HD-GYP domain-containing protein (c-di-GMP phosphodiesterase class II)